MKQILVIMLINFCVLPFSRCEEIWFNQNTTLHIFSTENETHKRLNKLFIERISETTSNFVVMNQNIDNYSLKSALREIRPFMRHTSVAIHLNVEDFYNHNYNDILKLGFIFAGNIGIENELPVCRSKTKNLTNVLERCQDSIEKQSNVKLVSETVINYSKLLEFITNFNEHDIDKSESTSPLKEPLVIGVCGLNEFIHDRMYLNKYYIEMMMFNTVWWMRLNLTYALDACKDSKTEGMIAMLTPEQFKPAETFVATTIFYDSQSLMPETKKMFQNSFVLLESTKNLKFAFLKFIQERKWNRVAIISDDSETSKEFEDGLTSLFQNANVVYASKSCDVSNCNFVEVFEPFVTAEPRVVIANIEEEYISEFLQQMSNKKTQEMDLVWLFRVRSRQVSYARATWNMTIIFTITLGPMIQQPYLLEECYSKPCNILSSLEALSEITHKYFDEIDQTRLTDEVFQRQLKRNITSYLNSGGSCKAYVHLNQEEPKSEELIAEMTITSSHEVIEYQEFHWNLPNFRQELTDCTFKSDVYFKMCDDVEVILIMLVVSVFSLGLLGIVFFFQTVR